MKKWLIKVLGGYTEQEYVNAFKYGAYGKVLQLRNYADSLYGVSAEDWCNSMYAKLNEDDDNLS